MDKTKTLCEGCIIMAICTEMCEETATIVVQSQEEAYSILKMKGGTSLMKRLDIRKIDFLRESKPPIKRISNEANSYIEAVDYAITNGYIATNDPNIPKLKQCKKNLARCKVIRDRINKNYRRKQGGI